MAKRNNSGLILRRADVNVLLLEGISETAAAAFKAAGYANVTNRSGSLGEDELIEILDGVHVVGVRSRTRITERVLANAPSLLSIGCFSVGFNQVALDPARLRGQPVFNAPFSNTRSVAELTIAEIVMLYRRAFPRAAAAHIGQWQKSAIGSHEVRGKTLGIIGYGNVGGQLSVLAEAFGMRVLFYDISDKLRLGGAAQVDRLEDLLRASDVVALHVPGTPATRNMIGVDELALMKRGAFLINNARGDVVDMAALRAALVEQRLGGAAVDVFPIEPKSNNEPFECPLQGLENVILTPHIGGSTAEAQDRIGVEVARKLIGFLGDGATVGAVNFPNVNPEIPTGEARLIHAHVQAPGALSRMSEAIDSAGARVVAQQFQTDGRIGYALVDVSGKVSEAASAVARLPSALATRLIDQRTAPQLAVGSGESVDKSVAA